MGNELSECLPWVDHKELPTSNQRTVSTTFKGSIPRESVGRNPLKYYTKLEELGRGSMGIVMKVKKKNAFIGGSAYESSRDNNIFISLLRNIDIFNSNNKLGEEKHTYAIKSIILERCSEDFINELWNEIEVLRVLDHPNIVKMHEIYEFKSQIYVVMELCSGGDLWTRAPYTEKQAITIVNKLVSAVAHMHVLGIIHRDIKLENIMFENRKPEAEIKLLDFGLSKKNTKGNSLKGGVGTFYTMAPQVLKGEYTNKADMWSVGVVAYILLSNRKPFDGARIKMVLNKIMRCDYNFRDRVWNHKSSEAKKFVSALIEKNEKKRLTAGEASASAWLTKSDLQEEDNNYLDDIRKGIVYHAESSLLKKISLMVIAHKSGTNEKLLRLRKAFNEFDKDNDGIISLNEFKEGLKTLEKSDKEINEIYEKMDVDNDGEVYYTEFIAATLEAQGLLEDDILAEAFDRIDSDDTGYVDKKNIKQLLGIDYDDKLVQESIAELDQDGDGQISFEEFRCLFKSKKEDVISHVYENF